jgi:hypothetical protein
MRTIALLALACLAGAAAAQSDGARPAEGAIKGGSIAPGESAGTPQREPAGSAAAGGSASRLARCYQLEGTLREQCLAQERDDPLNRGSEAPRSPTSGAPARRD